MDAEEWTIDEFVNKALEVCADFEKIRAPLADLTGTHGSSIEVKTYTETFSLSYYRPTQKYVVQLMTIVTDQYVDIVSLTQQINDNNTYSVKASRDVQLGYEFEGDRMKVEIHITSDDTAEEQKRTGHKGLLEEKCSVKQLGRLMQLCEHYLPQVYDLKSPPESLEGEPL